MLTKNTHISIQKHSPLRSQLPRSSTNINLPLLSQLMNQNTHGHEYWTPVSSKTKIKIKKKILKKNKKVLKKKNHKPAMDSNRCWDGEIVLCGMVPLSLIHQLDYTTTHLWHFTFNSWPTVVLELSNFYCIVYFTIRYVELSSSVVWTAFALHIFHQYMIVLDLIISPIPRTLTRSIANLSICCWFRKMSLFFM